MDTENKSFYSTLRKQKKKNKSNTKLEGKSKNQNK